MADRRMFSKTIIDSDAFLDMPLSSQSLYFHLSMRADDDGFINNPKKIQRMIGCSDDDLKILVAKKFIIPFESGIVVIKHWKIHNYIRNDRYKETVYQEEKSMLSLKENNAYTQSKNLGIPSDNQKAYQMETQVRLGKVRLGKVSIDKDIRHQYGEYKNVLLTDDELEKLKAEFPSDWQERIERLSCYIASKGTKYKNHLATIRNWARKDRGEQNAKDGSRHGLPADIATKIRECGLDPNDATDVQYFNSYGKYCYDAKKAGYPPVKEKQA